MMDLQEVVMEYLIMKGESNFDCVKFKLFHFIVKKLHFSGINIYMQTLDISMEEWV